MISFISTLRPVLKFTKIYLIGSKIILQEYRFQDVITFSFLFFNFFFPFPDYESFSRWPRESGCTNHWLEDVSSIGTCQGA